MASSPFSGGSFQLSCKVLAINQEWSSLKSLLFEAVARGENSSVCSILDQGISTDIRDKQRWTPLMNASYYGHLDIVKSLCDRGGDMAAADKAGFTALILAIDHGHSEVAMELIKRKADVNAVHYASKQPPLYTAASYGNSSITLSLLQHGANVNAQDSKGHTALHIASQEGHLDTVRILTEYGASVEVGDGDGGRPLHQAAKNNRPRVVKFLIEKGATVDQVGYKGATPLMWAALHTNRAEDCLEVLLEKGADPDKVNDDGVPALVYAVWGKRVKLAKRLMSVTKIRGKVGGKILADICRYGWEKLLREFLEKVRSLTQEEKLDILRSGMEAAAKYGKDKLAEIVLNEVNEEADKKKICEGILKSAIESDTGDIVKVVVGHVSQVPTHFVNIAIRRNVTAVIDSLMQASGVTKADKQKLKKIIEEKTGKFSHKKHKKNTMKDKIEDDEEEAKRKREPEEKKKDSDKKQKEERESEILRKREQEKLDQEERKADPDQEIQSRFQNICKEASTCLGNSVSSMEGFSRALEMVDKEYKLLWPTTQYKDLSHNEEIVVIKYMFARACGQTNNYESILAGLKMLDEIRLQHKPVRFPTVFYGLAILWMKLNRFEKAMAAVNEGIEFLDQGLCVTPHNWPGIPDKLVEETRKDILLEKLTSLKRELKYPPRPEAVCKWKECINIQSHIVPSEKIYISDPDYKGYFEVVCRRDCQVCYHKGCWMALKEEDIDKLKLAKVPTEKDFLGQSCLTPDCDGAIVNIGIFEDPLSKVRNIQDVKLIEKLEVGERKRKEEVRIKKEREEHEKRVKMFEKKQIQKTHEKHSKENSDGNDAAVEKKFKKKEKLPNWREYEKKKKGSCGNDVKEKCARQELFCCYPDGCSQKNGVLNANDLSDTQRMICSNSKCDQSKYMHLACLEKFEAKVVAFLKQQPRCRAWTQQQCFINLWKKGYGVAVKKCGCLCGNGTIRKDLGWTPPKAKVGGGQEGATAVEVEKSAEEDKFKLEECKESSISQEYVLGEKTKQKGVNLEPTVTQFIALNKESFADILNKSSESDKSSEYPTTLPSQQVPSLTSEKLKQEKVFTESKKKSHSIVTLEDSEESKEIDYSENVTASTNSHGYSQSSGEIMKRSSKESSTDALTEHVASGYSFQTDRSIHPVFMNKAAGASSKTDLALIKFGDLDPETLQQQNENLISELQDMKDKYKSMSEDNKNLRIENDSFKEKIGKIEKTVSEATKISEELRAKLLQNDLNKYRDIIRQKQENNLSVIDLLLESRELNNLPQIQFALSALNEYSARLLLAGDQLNLQYATLVRQAEHNQTIQEFQFDLASVEPPNLGPSCLNLLHNFVILSQPSSRPTASPFSFPPPAPILRSSTSSNLPVNPPPGYAQLSTIPIPESQVCGPRISREISSGSTTVSQDLLQTDSASGSPSSLSQASARNDVAKSGETATSATGSSATGTSAGPPHGASATYLTCTGTSAGPPQPSGAANSTGVNSRTDDNVDSSAVKSEKKYDKLIELLQENHPDLSPSQALDYVLRLRKSNNGKLSGMNIQDILDRVAAFIREDQDKDCSICFEDMDSEDCMYLQPCYHRFHKACINQWLESPGGAGSTCPMCRNYIVKEDEFPCLPTK